MQIVEEKEEQENNNRNVGSSNIELQQRQNMNYSQKLKQFKKKTSSRNDIKKGTFFINNDKQAKSLNVDHLNRNRSSNINNQDSSLDHENERNIDLFKIKNKGFYKKQKPE